MRVEQIGDWYFAVRPLLSGVIGRDYMSWCEKTPNLGNGPLDVTWLDDNVHFEYGATEGEALSKLKREVLN